MDLYALALLACPIGMGAMMFFMMRGNNRPSPDDGGGEHLGDAVIHGSGASIPASNRTS